MSGKCFTLVIQLIIPMVVKLKNVFFWQIIIRSI